MRISLNDPFTYIVMLLRNELPKTVFSDIDVPDRKRHSPLMEVLQKIIKEGLEISAENVYVTSSQNKLIVAEYMALLNDIDYKEMQKPISPTSCSVLL